MSAPSIDRSYYAEDGDYESTGTLLDYTEWEIPADVYDFVTGISLHWDDIWTLD